MLIKGMGVVFWLLLLLTIARMHSEIKNKHCTDRKNNSRI